MLLPPLCRRNRRHHAGAFANVTIPKGVVAIIALALLPVALALTPNIALASLPSSCNHHAVVFVTLALAVSPSLC
jgi:hypothetical protein